MNAIPSVPSRCRGPRAPAPPYRLARSSLRKARCHTCHGSSGWLLARTELDLSCATHWYPRTRCQSQTRGARAHRSRPTAGLKFRIEEWPRAADKTGRASMYFEVCTGGESGVSWALGRAGKVDCDLAQGQNLVSDLHRHQDRDQKEPMSGIPRGVRGGR